MQTLNSKDVRYQCTQLQGVVTVQKLPSTSNLSRRKVLTLHGHILATLVSQTTCYLRLVFAAPRGDLESSFYCTIICMNSQIFLIQS